MEWQRQLEDAGTATALRGAIEAIERAAHLAGSASAEALAPMLPADGDRWGRYFAVVLALLPLHLVQA